MGKEDSHKKIDVIGLIIIIALLGVVIGSWLYFNSAYENGYAYLPQLHEPVGNTQ